MAGVSGWIGESKDYLKVWSKLETPDSEMFSLVWESKALLTLNSAIGSYMAQQAYQEVAKWAITHVSHSTCPVSSCNRLPQGGPGWHECEDLAVTIMSNEGCQEQSLYNTRWGA